MRCARLSPKWFTHITIAGVIWKNSSPWLEATSGSMFGFAIGTRTKHEQFDRLMGFLFPGSPEGSAISSILYMSLNGIAVPLFPLPCEMVETLYIRPNSILRGGSAAMG